MQPWYERVPFYLFLLTLAPYVLCLFYYGTRSPWQKSPTGRALIAMLASLVAVLGFAVLVQVTVIPKPILDVMRGVLLGGVALAGWVMLRQIVQLQRERSDPPRRRSTDLPDTPTEEN